MGCPPQPKPSKTQTKPKQNKPKQTKTKKFDSLLFLFSDFPCFLGRFSFLFQGFWGFRKEKNPCFFLRFPWFFFQKGKGWRVRVEANLQNRAIAMFCGRRSEKPCDSATEWLRARSLPPWSLQFFYQLSLDSVERKIISKLDFQLRTAGMFWLGFTVVGVLSSDRGETGAGPLTRTYLTLTAMLAIQTFGEWTRKDRTCFQLRSHSPNSG